MKAFDRFNKREEMLSRTFEIDEDLYEKLEYLSKNELDASINKLLDASIQYLVDEGNVELYKSKRGNYITRSFSVRASLIERMYELKKKYKISIYMLVNLAIKNSLDEYENDTEWKKELFSSLMF